MAKAPPAPDFSRVAAEVRRRLGSFGDITGLAALVGFGGLLSFGLYKSVYFVDGGCRAIKFNAITGLKNRTYTEGANFSIPILETPIIFDIRNKPTEVLTATGSRDLQTVNLAVRVLYQPNVGNLPSLYRNVGVEYAETVLPSLVNEIIRAVIAQFNASELLVRRPEVSSRIGLMLAERAKQFHIDITDVSITQMSFGKEYTNAVEAKQVAQQMAERARWRVEQAEQEKKGAILLAEGEAEAARLIGQAVQKNPAFITLRSLEASRAIANMIKEKGQGNFYLNSNILSLGTSKNASESGSALV
ncbi:SPFH domain [Trypanosoma vivax]|uniref:Prohibitin n=1 Tax=Trypanosoma vivax (strain Y486) TaxID=1055687 RepID=G0U674_TRYVY|nr:prohibitin [Trypanosoma vivax]KAH8608181.1 SPFH domain [Trypanosoma vivax]CCC51377.1 putative prohibitin [Trypanosoma vivax Y486]